MSKHRSTLLVILFVCSGLLAGCGGRAYIHEPYEAVTIRDRAETQSEGAIRVSAAVPGREETEAIFGISLYEQGIQPVWLEVENSGTEQIRYAPVSTDRFYFSPLEVAYKNRGGYTDEARLEMERRFHGLAMPRYIDPAESRSGFVFTHADFGAKGFNVDLFGSGKLHSFTFLLRVPGFEPDYANVDFDSIYTAEEITALEGNELHGVLKSLPCCSQDENGRDSGEPLNMVLVGGGPDLLRALLRSNWRETSTQEAAVDSASYLFGRKQDGIFRYHSQADDSVFELRLWLAPFTSGLERVWIGQLRHFYTFGPLNLRFDPDVDTARNFGLQNFFYGQTIRKLAWISGEDVVPVDTFWSSLTKPTYFTDGHCVVLWLSGEPVSVLKTEALNWDASPGWKQ